MVSGEPLTVGGQISGINFPSDIIVKDASERQQMIGNIQFDKNLNVSGQVFLDENLNGINLDRLCDLVAINGQYGIHILGSYYLVANNYSYFLPTFFAIGSANLTSEPLTQIVNGQDLRTLTENAWFVNEQTTTIPGNIIMENVEFEQPIGLKVRWLCRKKIQFVLISEKFSQP